MELSRKYFFSDKVIPYFVLLFIGILFLLPLLWVVFASIDPNASVMLKVPANPTLQNYASVIAKADNRRAFGVGLMISLVETLLVIICTCLAAYPLSRYQMRHKRLFMYVLLFMTSLPITAVMVPVYEEFVTLKLYDNLFGVILFMTASSLPYGIWMMKNFMDSIPVELEEAAWVDGATPFVSLIRIILPLMMPGICTVAIFTFSGSWGNFFVPFILLTTAQKLPASVQLYQFFGEHGLIAYGPLAAYSILYAFPSVILYLLSQSFMSKGFSMQGATKG